MRRTPGGSRVLAALVVLSAATVVLSACYQNPVSDPGAPSGLADPAVVRVGTTYYAYGSNLPLNTPSQNIPVLTSSDLAHWTPAGDALPALPAWATSGATWAPGMLVRDDGAPLYVLFFTAVPVSRGNGTHCIGTATSRDPLGPFAPSASPLVCQADHNGAIDPSPFVIPGNGPNGAAALFWKSEDNLFSPARATNIWSQPLSADGQSFLPGSSPAAVLTATYGWEHGQVEGPVVTYDAASGHDILFYTGHYWYNEPAYNIGWAVCTPVNGVFPAGSCTRGQSGPWVKSTNDVCAPSGPDVFSDPDGYTWLAYDSYIGPADPHTGKCVGFRKLRIDKLCFAAGIPRTNAPSTAPVVSTRSRDCATDVP